MGRRRWPRLVALVVAAAGVALGAGAWSGAKLTREVLELDGLHGGSISGWAQSAGAGDGRSRVLLLTGNDAVHLDGLRGALAEWNPGYLQRDESFLVVEAREPGPGPTFALDRTAAWIREREYAGEVPWSVVFVRHAQLLSPFDVNELVLTFHNKAQCTSAQLRLDARCDKLLVVLSTSFGREDVYVAPPGATESDSELEQRSRETVAKAALRELGAAWLDGRGKLRGVEVLQRNFRRMSLTLLGPPDQGRLALVVARQDAARAARRAAREAAGNAGCDATGIDVDVLTRAGFVGQAKVLEQVRRSLLSTGRGLKSGGGPLIFLFAGPPGLGKTFLGQLIARAYNCGADIETLTQENKFVHVDMVNYQDPRSVDAFVDPSPGLEGSGVLSQVFQAEARTVVLLDEIEKCHPDLVQRMLLPMLDSNNGHVQSKKTGLHVPTKDAIFVLTTNCFSDALTARIAHGSGASYAQLADEVGAVMRNASMRCEGAADTRSNPFASDALWRRLFAGHALANPHGLFLFLPPSPEEVDALVLDALERLSSSGDGGRQLYYTGSVLRFLQRKMRARFQSGTQSTATIAPFVQGMVAPLLLNLYEPRIVLQVSKTGVLEAHALPVDGEEERGQEQACQLSQAASPGGGGKGGGEQGAAAEHYEPRQQPRQHYQSKHNGPAGVARQEARAVEPDKEEEVDRTFDSAHDFAAVAALVALATVVVYLLLPAVVTVTLNALAALVAVAAALAAAFWAVAPEALRKAVAALVYFVVRFRHFIVPGAGALLAVVVALRASRAVRRLLRTRRSATPTPCQTKTSGRARSQSI